jgi:transglutaminase-like putative cysteine protease
MVQLCSRFVVPRIKIVRVPKGRAGTLATAELIGRLLRSGAKDFYVRQKAIEVLRAAGVRPKDRFGEICALFEWVRRNIRYTRDIVRVELLHTARRMLELRAGDCDDMTILLGAMLTSVGHPVRLVLTGFRSNQPHVYSHVYPEVQWKGHWIPIDPTVSRPMGWAPPALWKCICHIEEEGIRCSRKTP